MRLWELSASCNLYLSSYIKVLELEIIPSSPHIGSGTWRRAKHRAKRVVSRRIHLSPYVKALGLGKMSREAWRQDLKDMNHDLYFLTWLINQKVLELSVDNTTTGE